MFKTLLQQWGLPAELAEGIHKLVVKERKQIRQQFQLCLDQISNLAVRVKLSNHTKDCKEFSRSLWGELTSDWWKHDDDRYEHCWRTFVDLAHLSPYERKAMVNWLQNDANGAYDRWSFYSCPTRLKDDFCIELVRRTGLCITHPDLA